jgi:imidazolonepropionase-like amidohydrolase
MSFAIALRRACIALLSLAGGAAPAAAQEGAVHAFVNVRAVTFDAAGVIEDATVIVRGDRIEAVGPAGEVAVPEGARVHEGLGRTLLPGLVDAHVHLAGRALRGLDPSPEAAARRALWFGVTTVVDLNSKPESIFALRERSRRSRELPRVLCAGAAIAADGGHGTQGGFPALRLHVDGDAKSLVTRAAALAPDFVKIMIDEGGYALEPKRAAPSDEDVAKVIAASHAEGLLVAAHVVEARTARRVAARGADVLAHLPFEGEIDGPFARDLASRGTRVIPALAAVAAQFRPYVGDDEGAVVRDLGSWFEGLPSAGPGGDDPPGATPEAQDGAGAARSSYFEARYEALLAALVRLHENGVTLVAGSDAGMPNAVHGLALHQELEEWVTAGIAPHAALAAATVHAAALCGLGDRIGRIAVGYEADLVLVDGNPLKRIEDARRVVLVLRGGAEAPRSALRESFALAPPGPEFVEQRLLFDFEQPADARALRFGGRLAADVEVPREASIVAAQATAEAQRFLRFTAQLPEPVGLECPLQLELDVASRLPNAAFAEYRALRFKARAVPAASFRLLLLTTGVRSTDPHGRAFAADERWRSYELDLAEFAQVGFGDRVRLDRAAVTAIGIALDPQASGARLVEIDDVTLLR